MRLPSPFLLGILLLLQCLVPFFARSPPFNLDCDPCIRRSDFVVRAIVHGTKEDLFWQKAQAAMEQAATDMGVALQMELCDTFDVQQMALDITQATQNQDMARVDALIVTIPSEILHPAIQGAVQSGLPVFGFNAGYKAFEELGVISFVAQDEYLAGVHAAEHFLRLRSAEDNSTLSSPTVLFVNHEKGNQAMEERHQGFKDTLMQSNQTFQVQELVLDLHDQKATKDLIEFSMMECRYNMILIGGVSAASPVLDAANKYGCFDGDTTIATFDLSDRLQRNILLGQLAFALDQQEYLQAALPVVLAATYATTSNAIVPTLEAKTYLSGPIIVHKHNLPSDTVKACKDEAFPICSNTNKALDTACACIDRSKIRIGGVLHGHTSDLFWDPIYLAAENAAKDMGVQLENERLAPQDNATVLNHQMAAQMRSLCESGIDGLFVTIPESQSIYDAIAMCQQLNVPVIAVNSNPKVSQQVGVPHIGQDEYGAGYLSGQRMVEAGLEEGYCVGRASNTGVTARCTGFVDAIKAKGLTAAIVEAPLDMDSRFTLVFEEAVGRDEGDPWSGVGWLVGAHDLEPTLKVQEQHPNLLIGTADVGSYGEIVFQSIDEGKLLFVFDQQPFLQGHLPVYLLTYMAYTKQKLLDDIILTGPSFITARPTPAQQTCEGNMWAVCANIPVENLNYISKGWLGVGYFLAAATILSGMACLGWLFIFREQSVVKASQPPFLAMLALGGIVSGCAIVAMGMETDYRTTIDPFTGEVTGLNEDVGRVDAACMAVPWLYGLGFCLMFSALLAKIWRIKLIYKAAMEMRRGAIGYTNVMPVLAAMFTLELVILISWQATSPLEWTREVTLYSYDGYPLESVGTCNSDSGWHFMAGLVSYHILCLFYALVLCWQARDIPPDFADSNWVSLSVLMIFQVSILAIPIAAMVQDETDVFYFVRACALFLQSFTVLCLIFVPKMYKTSHGDTVSVPRMSSTMPGKTSMSTSFKLAQNSRLNSSMNSQPFTTNSQVLPPRPASTNKLGCAGHFANNSSHFASESISETVPLVSPCCRAEMNCSSCGLVVSSGSKRKPGGCFPNAEGDISSDDSLKASKDPWETKEASKEIAHLKGEEGITPTGTMKAAEEPEQSKEAFEVLKADGLDEVGPCDTVGSHGEENRQKKRVMARKH